MKALGTILVGWGLAMGFCISSARANDVESYTRDYVQEVASYLIGHLETLPAQNSAGKTYQVRMTTCEIANQDDPDRGMWLYQEQGILGRLDQPYRQRFLHLVTADKDSQVQSISYRPIEPNLWVGLCDRVRENRQVREIEMIDQQCTVTLTPLITVYQGETPAQGCPTSLRGAASITNTIVLYAGGMDTWDRGYDAEGQLLWGAKDKPYEFIRRIIE